MALRIEVREMRRSDIEAVLELFDAVAAERVWIGTEPGFDRSRYGEVFAAAIGRGNGMFSARAEGRLVGIATEHLQEPYGHMVGMIVDERYRGRGVGRALLERLIAFSRKAGYPHLNLSVFPHNARAIALYQSCGFEELEALPGGVRRANGEIWDALVMRKRLG